MVPKRARPQYELQTPWAPKDLYSVIHKHFKNLQQIDYTTDHGNSYADRQRNSPHISQMLNVSTFGNTADIYAIVHLVPHACQHITVDGPTCYYCLLAANQGKYVRELFLKKTWEVSLSIGVRITMIHCVVYFLLIFKMFNRLMNNPVFLITIKLHGVKNSNTKIRTTTTVST
jgi:hypothetical protein